MILHMVRHWLRQNMHQRYYSLKTPHSLPSLASYGVSLVEFLKCSALLICSCSLWSSFHGSLGHAARSQVHPPTSGFYLRCGQCRRVSVYWVCGHGEPTATVRVVAGSGTTVHVGEPLWKPSLYSHQWETHHSLSQPEWCKNGLFVCYIVR